jgi:MFS family permease
VLSLALFVVIELEVAEPLLDIRVFRYWPYTNSLLLIAVLMIGLFGILFYIPLFLQQVQGLGAFDAGLTLLPQAVVMGVLMPITGRLYDRIGPRSWPGGQLCCPPARPPRTWAARLSLIGLVRMPSTSRPSCRCSSQGWMICF